EPDQPKEFSSPMSIRQPLPPQEGIIRFSLIFALNFIPPGSEKVYPESEANVDAIKNITGQNQGTGTLFTFDK
ncbi:hypothetical protein KAR91_44150, partial [Candidatus Pacearchaeota archaeon]|nr:hypothetical protein [Candidatus Pacearchaeota archaeon]